MEKDLTTGSVFKNVILFSLPYLLSYFLQTLYGMADLFFMGQFEGIFLLYPLHRKVSAILHPPNNESHFCLKVRFV